MLREGEVVGILMRPRQRRILTTTGLVVSLLALVVWPPMTLGAFGERYAGIGPPLVTVLVGVTVLLFFVFSLLFYMYGMLLMGVSEKSVTIGYSVLGLRFGSVWWPTSEVIDVHVVQGLEEGESKLELELRDGRYRLPALLDESDARRISEALRYVFV